MRSSFLTLAVVLTTGLNVIAADTPLAWVNFAEHATQTYDSVPYLWLGDAPIYLTIDVPPAGDHAIDLLWGSKNDQRAAEITVNDTPQSLEAGGYNGFQWQRVSLPENLSGEKYEVLLQAAASKAAFLAVVRLVQTDAPIEQPLPDALIHRIAIAEPPPHALDEWMEQLQDEGLDNWQRATIYGQQANEALRRCRKYVDGWLAPAVNGNQKPTSIRHSLDRGGSPSSLGVFRRPYTSPPTSPPVPSPRFRIND